MIALADHPKLRQLARNLHIPDQGDCLAELRDHALASVRRIIREWTVETIDELRMLVADRLSVKIEYISDDADVDRLADIYGHVMSHFRRILKTEFLKHDTEGLLVDNPHPGKGGRDYLAIIDARGPRKARAYFTSWHELAHLLLYPRKQLVLEGFRRTPMADAKQKDPVESAVDHIAGLLAFWEPLFVPALLQAAGDGLTFDAIESATAVVAPGASLFAAALAAVRLWPKPAAFLTAEIAAKTNGSNRCLRVQSIMSNELAREAGYTIRKHMRVPESSALYRVSRDPFGRAQTAVEDQSWWSVSDRGPLPVLGWQVHAAKRGPAVYGIVSSVGKPGLRSLAINTN